MAKKSSPQPTKHISISKKSITIHRTQQMRLAIAILSMALLLVGVYLGTRAVKIYVNKMRLQEIIAVYDSLKLDDSYRVDKMNVFGDKRVYEWDKSRTYASQIEYGHNATPKNTRADLRAKAEAGGFSFVQTEYEGSVQPIDEFKNAKGNYLRIGVTNSGTQNAMIYGTDDLNTFDPEKDDAPSYVSVKVNLDDNNE